jgi:uncharacterized protein
MKEPLPGDVDNWSVMVDLAAFGLLSPWLLRTTQTAKVLLTGKDPAHDWSHARRVLRLALEIGETESCDLQVVAAASLLHDVVQLGKDTETSAQAGRVSAVLAVDVLLDAGAPTTLVPAVSEAIASHNYSLGIAAPSIESAVLQDADRLDALGAVGLARTWTMTGVMGRAFADHREPLPRSRPLDDRRFALDHFVGRLLSLHLSLNTARGREIAQSRRRLVETHFAELLEELGVEATA